MYAAYLKRPIDFVLSIVALILLSPVMLVLTVVGAVVMGGNTFFMQIRPGKGEKLFKLVKFRSMTNRRDKNGNLLPDDQRLTPYGKMLRSTSLDELPELWNILRGEMSVVGPRPQLVRDMVFMTDEQRMRHSVRQGLTGLAQVNGRNNMTWENKLSYDLQYIEKITFWGDLKIILLTVKKVLIRDGISAEGSTTAEDYGDYLLRTGAVSQDEYDFRQKEAEELLGDYYGQIQRVVV